MPKLLSINNYYYRRGGAEVVFLEQNRMFEEIGWQVIPFCMQHEKNQPTPWARYFVDEIEFGQQYSLLRKIHNAAKITYSFEARDKMRRLIADERPQIAHAHNVYHHISPSFFSLLKQERIPTVLTLHDLKIACPAYKMLTHDGVCERCKGGALFNVVRHQCIKDSRVLSSVIYVESTVQQWLGTYTNNVDRFVVPSRFYIEKLVEWGWPRERFRYVPNFVDIDAHHPDTEIGRAFLYFGRLGPEKGLKTLVRAAALTRLPLWIVGTGPEEEALKKLAVESGADVTFFGYRSGLELHRLIKGARVMVLPSEWYENAPMSVMEAYALGRPALGARIGGIPELIRPGHTGDTFESGSAESLAEKMCYFSGLPDAKISELGMTGRSWVAEEFTLHRYRDRLSDLYAELGVRP